MEIAKYIIKKYYILRSFVSESKEYFKNKNLYFTDNSISWDHLFKIYNIKIDSIDDVQIISYFQNNIDPQVIKKQNDVFSKLNIPILQVEKNCSHGEFMTQAMKEFAHKKFIIFFDIDCIPLKRYAIIQLLLDIDDKKTLAGAVQTANHKKEGKNIYVGPFFLGISTELFHSLGLPSLEKSEHHDVAGILTERIFEKGFKVKYWFPTNIEIPKWKLYPDSFFGKGTTYNGLVYHSFEIRNNRTRRFINACNRVLNER